MFGPLYWVVLAITVIAWWRSPRRWRHALLATVSFAWLLYLQPLTALSLGAWAVAFHRLAPLHGRTGWRRWVVPALIVAILTQLFAFKYLPVLDGRAAVTAEGGLLLPMGISYFTFKLIHHGIETARGAVPERPASTFFSWVFAFPMLSAGPIERFDHYCRSQPDALTSDDLSEGLTRIAYGLIKKVLLADLLLADVLRSHRPAELLAALPELGVHQVWWFLIGTFLFNYLDFSAYSDLAIGSCRLMGLRLAENFNWPIAARSIGDFWKRWHMTLTGWCQSYVYMPTLGASRNPYIAVFATFIVMGLWHMGTWNWLCWGLWHATGVAVFLTWSRFKRQRHIRWGHQPVARVMGHVATLAFVSAGYAFTSIQGVGGPRDSVRILAACVGLR